MTSAAERYAFVSIGREGLLLDFASGNLFQLNESASLVWTNALDGKPVNAIADLFASRYGLPLLVAQEDVSRALTLTPDDGATIDEPDGPYAYERSSHGYVFSRDRAPLLEVDELGSLVRPVPGSGVGGDAFSVLQAVSPKLLALRGHLVLHASAVLSNGCVFALSGRSGAGKTTTARALAHSGAELISEDKLLFRAAANGVEVVIDGERRIMEWVGAAAARLSAGEQISCADLDAATRGEVGPLCGVGFLDSARRGGASIKSAILDRLDATRAVFRNTFHGSDRPEQWKRHLESAAQVTGLLPAYDLAVPAGVAALQLAARQTTLREVLGQTAITAS